MSNIISRLLSFAFASLFVLSFCSCRTYNFSHPLPSDKPNIYTFPSSWQGEWIDADGQLLIVGSDFAAIIIRDTSSVMKGEWPKKNEKGEFIYPADGYRAMFTINMDSLNNPKDTIANYIISADHIYEINVNRRLEKGYPFDVDQDTLRIYKDDTIWIDLGRNAFLRQLSNDFYVVNIVGQAMGTETRWWQIVGLEKTGRNSIDRWDCCYKLTEDSSMFYSMHEDYYFNSTWKTDEMVELIRNGFFEKCSPFKRMNAKL